MYPGDESHCGMVFCAVDSIVNIGAEFDIIDKPALLDFLTHRQIDFNEYNARELRGNEYVDEDDIGGFNGRWNKYGDTCYVFWALASLQLLDCTQLVDKEKAREFLRRTVNLHMGGFNKTTDPDEMPDPMHSFLGLCALSILGDETLGELDCQLVIPV